MAEKRVILRAELHPKAKAGLERTCQERGMTQLSVMSRLILWFAEQDGKTQHAILGHTGDNAGEMLMRNLMKKISDSAKK